MNGLTLLSIIGEGGSSVVWKAWDEINHRHVAVKILKSDKAASATDIRAFRHEERVLEEIHHPGIVQAYDFDCCDGQWYFVMEYVDGYSFASYLESRKHIKEEDCLLICESIASALDYAWNEHGIVHCDIKPENIMINSSGEIKLMDLGLAKRFRYSKTGTQKVPEHILGTPDYISPEQIYGDVILDCRSDIYSLGASLYTLATGRTLFPELSVEDTMRAHCEAKMQAPDPRTFRKSISEGFAQLLEIMLVKNRDYRLSSWAQVCEMAIDVERGISFKPRRADSPSSIKLIAPDA